MGWTDDLRDIALDLEAKSDPKKAEDIIRDLSRQLREFTKKSGASREMLDEIRAAFGQYKFETAGRIDELEKKLLENRVYTRALEDSLLRPDGEAARFWAQTIREERAEELGKNRGKE